MFPQALTSERQSLVSEMCDLRQTNPEQLQRSRYFDYKARAPQFAAISQAGQISQAEFEALTDVAPRFRDMPLTRKSKFRRVRQPLAYVPLDVLEYHDGYPLIFGNGDILDVDADGFYILTHDNVKHRDILIRDDVVIPFPEDTTGICSIFNDNILLIAIDESREQQFIEVYRKNYHHYVYQSRFDTDYNVIFMSPTFGTSRFVTNHQTPAGVVLITYQCVNRKIGGQIVVTIDQVGDQLVIPFDEIALDEDVGESRGMFFNGRKIILLYDSEDGEPYVMTVDQQNHMQVLRLPVYEGPIHYALELL